MYLMKIMEEKNGLPLNNIELNAVLREYNGAQVKGFCNHVVGIINPVAKFLTKQKFVIKDSIKRNGEIVMQIFVWILVDGWKKTELIVSAGQNILESGWRL